MPLGPTHKSIQSAIEASENRLPIAFHDWASPIEVRVKSHSHALRVFDRENEN